MHPDRLFIQQRPNQVKAGKNKSGSQRFRCNLCRRQYTPARTRKYDVSVFKAVIKLYKQGHSFRQIGRELGLSHNTVAAWVDVYITRD